MAGKLTHLVDDAAPYTEHWVLDVPPYADWQLRDNRTVSIAEIFRSEMDALTYRLESQGYRVWFTCEANGVEYRLAARYK